MSKKSINDAREDFIKLIFLVAVVIIALGSYIYTKITEWLKAHWIWAIIIGILLIGVIIIGVYILFWYYITNKKIKAEVTTEIEKEKEIHKSIIRKRLLKERAEELKGLNEEEKEYLLTNWIESEYRREVLNADRLRGISSREVKPERVPINPSLQRALFRAHHSRCAMCGLLEHLEIHHIDGDRSNNNAKNLIPLCRNCHGKNFRQEQLKARWKPPYFG